MNKTITTIVFFVAFSPLAAHAKSKKVWFCIAPCVYADMGGGVIQGLQNAWGLHKNKVDAIFDMTDMCRSLAQLEFGFNAANNAMLAKDISVSRERESYVEDDNTRTRSGGYAKLSQEEYDDYSGEFYSMGFQVRYWEEKVKKRRVAYTREGFRISMTPVLPNGKGVCEKTTVDENWVPPVMNDDARG